MNRFLDDAEKLLTERLGNARLANPRENTGVRLIVESGVPWRTRVGDWITSAEEVIRTRHMSAHKNGKQIQFTSVSICIGEEIAYEAGLDDTDPRVTLPLGDLILEALSKAGILHIELVRLAKGATRYILHYHGRTFEKALMKATFTSPPGKINRLRSPSGHPFIKGWTGEGRQEQFQKLLSMDLTFIQCLNKLRNTGWELNRPVLEVLRNSKDKFFHPTISLTRNGQTIEIDVNEKMKAAKEYSRVFWADDPERRFEGKDDIRLQQIRSKNYEYMTIMQKTQHESVAGTFYQDYNCDWRGRIYCLESFLQFQGTDMARGLFLFAEKKKYNADGIRRLKIHIANSYNTSISIDDLPEYFTEDYRSKLLSEGLEEISLDKLSLEDRILWTENNWFWLETATDLLLLSGKKSAENPVALLAAILELRNVLADPDYEGGLPIPLDGSNNGWQHLSAMSKDRQSADLVSCTDVPLQNDFYVAVAKEMIKLSPEWFKSKNMRMKEIRKGLAKRGAMTRAYSAGKETICENMWADVRQQRLDIRYQITKDDCFMLAGKLIEAVNRVCSGPLRLTQWLQAVVAHEITGSVDQKENSPGMLWITPSGFPVVYTAAQQIGLRVRSSFCGSKISHQVKVNEHYSEKVESIDPETGEVIVSWERTSRIKPDRKKFAKGIAPNVVHSFDAAHLAMTMTRFSGSMAVVHDSFATHACDVEEMLQHTKECFIELYDTPNWFDDFKHSAMRFSETFTKPNPELGTYDVREVSGSRYFFC